LEQTFRKSLYTNKRFLEHVRTESENNVWVACYVVCNFSLSDLQTMFPIHDTDVFRHAKIECRVGSLGDVTIKASLLSKPRNDEKKDGEEEEDERRSNPDDAAYSNFMLFGNARIPLDGNWTSSLGRNADVPRTVIIVEKKNLKSEEVEVNDSIFSGDSVRLVAVSRITPEDCCDGRDR